MIVQVLAVMDVKVGTFAQPFFSSTVASGQRSFREAARDRTTTLGTYPEDFQLWSLGCFDDSSGMFTQVKPKLVCTAEEVLFPLREKKDEA